MSSNALSGPRKKLLFVDDEPDILLILGETFKDEHDVQVAESGEQALQILERGPIDLLVTDQKMPRMKGVDLIAKARERYPDLVCIMLTAYSDPPDLIDVINRGPVYRFLTKPWDTYDLIQTVQNALAYADLTRENAMLLAQTQRRLNALEAFYEVSSAAGSLRSHAEIVDEISALLARVVDLEASATLVKTGPGGQATLTLRSTRPLPQAELRQLTETAREAHETLSGHKLGDDDLLVRFTGPGIGQGEDKSVKLRSQLFVPLTTSGEHAGVLLVGSSREGAFDRDDERVLDILANRLADTLLGLRSFVDDERRRLERMVECMADGLVMTDASGEVVVYNAVARSLLGVDEHHELTSRMLRDKLSFYPFELVRGWERLGTHAIAEDLQVGERSLHSVVSPVTDTHGQLAGVVVVLRNVTEQRELDKKREQFISDITHEVRTPLTSIIGALDLVLGGASGELNERQRQYLTMVRTSVGKLNKLVDNLLDLSKATQHRLSLELRETQLDDLVADAVERYRPAFTQENVEIALKAPSVPVEVHADGGRLDQVLNNLLTNAVRFTPKGGRVEVEVFARAETHASAGFSVWNSGAHIKGQDLERIFDQWEQAEHESERDRRVRGTGLGLPICRRIVEAHGGRIWAESAEGKGVSFVVVLPQQAKEEASSEGDPLMLPVATPGRTGESRASVLVVDDDRAAAYVVKSTLLAAGFQVEVAHSADEALLLARQSRPTVMVIDVRMPDVDGVELIEILRNDPDTRGTPIVAMSGYDEAARARRARAHAFLPKPLDPSRLVATLSELAFGRLSVGQGILVVDGDAAARDLAFSALSSRRYNLEHTASIAACKKTMSEFRPDLLLLDPSLPDGNGLELLRELKSDRNTSSTSIIVLSAQSEIEVKVKALRLGADDYVTKPFDSEELAARVETVLRRRELELAASPTTRLPGGLAIEAEVNRRITSGLPYTLCYLDLDNLKAFNDYYGYPKADGVIRQTGDILREVVSANGTAEDFLGHIAGDDFVLITAPQRAELLCDKVLSAFRRIIPLYYNREDRDRGFIEATDRHGRERRFPIMGLSAVAVTDPGGRYEGHGQIALRAAELKNQAKAIEGSVFLADDETRRTAAAKLAR